MRSWITENLILFVVNVAVASQSQDYSTMDNIVPAGLMGRWSKVRLFEVLYVIGL